MWRWRSYSAARSSAGPACARSSSSRRMSSSGSRRDTPNANMRAAAHLAADADRGGDPRAVPRPLEDVRPGRVALAQLAPADHGHDPALPHRLRERRRVRQRHVAPVERLALVVAVLGGEPQLGRAPLEQHDDARLRPQRRDPLVDDDLGDVAGADRARQPARDLLQARRVGGGEALGDEQPAALALGAPVVGDVDEDRARAHRRTLVGEDREVARAPDAHLARPRARAPLELGIGDRAPLGDHVAQPRAELARHPRQHLADRAAEVLLLRDAVHAREGGVDAHEAHLLVEDREAGGRLLEDGLEQRRGPPPRRLELVRAPAQRVLRLGERGRHRVERAREAVEVAGPALGHAHVQVAGGDPPRRDRDVAHRARDAPRDVPAERADEHEQDEQPADADDDRAPGGPIGARRPRGEMAALAGRQAIEVRPDRVDPPPSLLDVGRRPRLVGRGRDETRERPGVVTDVRRDRGAQAPRDALVVGIRGGELHEAPRGAGGGRHARPVGTEERAVRGDDVSAQRRLDVHDGTLAGERHAQDALGAVHLAVGVALGGEGDGEHHEHDTEHRDRRPAGHDRGTKQSMLVARRDGRVYHSRGGCADDRRAGTREAPRPPSQICVGPTQVVGIMSVRKV